MEKTLPLFDYERFVERAESVYPQIGLTDEEEGVFLNLPQNWDANDIYGLEFIKFLIDNKNLETDAAKLARDIKNGQRRIKISETIGNAETDEGFFIAVTPDKLQAYMILVPASEGGNRTSPAAILHLLSSRHGIRTGINGEKIIAAFEEASYYTPILAAEGKSAVDGDDAIITFLFDQNKTQRPLPKVAEGKIDYRTLNLFENVSKGQVLVEKTMPTKGISGINIFGEAIIPAAGRDFPLPNGKNCEFAKFGLQLVSAIDGRVEYINKRVVVSNKLVIDKDVDLKTGNIDFNGDVIVRGNVLAGMSIQSAGSIEVLGAVEAANLDAGGSIVLHMGMQGMDTGVIRSNGNIVSQFFERATVYAAGSITADSILHCSVYCNDRVLCKGKRGMIVGGTVRAVKSVTAKFISTESAVSTCVEVGISPGTRERGLALEERMNALTEEINKCSLILKSLPNANMEPQKRVIISAQMRENRKKFEEELSAYQQEMEQIVQILEAATTGGVNVSDTAYPGTTICIGSLIEEIKTKIQFATFKIVDGRITFGPFEGQDDCQ